MIARKVADLGVPAGLRERCLAERPRAAVRARRGWRSAVLPLAAVLALGLMVFGLVTWSNRDGADSLRVASEEFAEFFDSDFELELQTDDLAKIQDWSASHHVGQGVQIPAGFDGVTPFGCRTIEWGGEKGALVCFQLEDGRLAHLIVIPNGAFSDPPGSEREIARVGRWDRSAWSEDGMTYLVFTPDGADVG